MNCIVISKEKFLVNTAGETGQIANEVVCISTVKTENVGTYHGGINKNVQAYSFKGKQYWDRLSKTFPIISLKSRPELMNLYNKIHNANDDQFESTEDFVESHGYYPTNA